LRLGRYNSVASSSPAGIISPRLVSIGIWFTVTPGGGVNPVAPPWLTSGVRSIQNSISVWSTPSSWRRMPRDHTAAVCWNSGTSMPASRRTRIQFWKK
jgi:hypothetical protein